MPADSQGIKIQVDCVHEDANSSVRAFRTWRKSTFTVARITARKKAV